VTRLRAIGLAIVLGVAALSWALTCSAWHYQKVVAGVAPLDARDFDRLTLITLGTGGAYENPDRLGPSTALGLGSRVVLVDTGRAVAEALRAAGVPVSQPDTVLLTGLLPENTVGLDDLLLGGWLDGRSRPLRLVGPPGTRELAEALAAGHRHGIAAGAALGLEAAGADFEVTEIGDGWSARLGDLRLRAAALPGGPVEALAYRFEWRDRSAVVGGPGWAPDAFLELARGAGLLVHEAVFVPTPELAAEIQLDVDPERLRREAALHTSIDQVGSLAQRAGAGTLVLVRLRPPPVYDFQITSIVNDSFAGRIAVAEDGDEFTP
jgi:ribonuclease BN (tRNA processing enzyme)